jgi:SNF2 family DNA or RNA helicase
MWMTSCENLKFQGFPFLLHLDGKLIMAPPNPPPLWNGFHYKPHQLYGIEWLVEREQDKEAAGGLVCDEMGLGKTIQLIGLMKTNPKKKTLLLVPLAVLEQWVFAANKAGINCWRATKEGWKPAKKITVGASHLYVSNYERAIRNPSLVEGQWDRMICDEAHRIGNDKTNGYALVASVKAKAKWFLTATPIVNKAENIECLFGLLGIDYSIEDKEMTKKYVLARTMDDLRERMPELPKKACHVRHILEFDTPEEADFYRGIQGMAVKRWNQMEADGGANAFERFKIIMRLRQISLHPQIYISARKKQLGKDYARADWIDNSTKFNRIRDLLENEKRSQKWIIFCHFHEEMDLLAEFLAYSDRIGLIQKYNGSMSAEEREAVLSKTHNHNLEKHEVLLVQLQSGGTGLNLQHFTRIIFSGPWWTSALMDQAVGRAVRIGQNKKVMVHHMILREEMGLNIDAMMNEKAKEKGKLCRQVLREADHTI